MPEEASYPRRPLRIALGETDADGNHIDAERILRPGDPDYESAYRHAVAVSKRWGDAMPYVAEENAAPFTMPERTADEL